MIRRKKWREERREKGKTEMEETPTVALSKMLDKSTVYDKIGALTF